MYAKKKDSVTGSHLVHSSSPYPRKACNANATFGRQMSTVDIEKRDEVITCFTIAQQQAVIGCRWRLFLCRSIILLRSPKACSSIVGETFNPPRSAR
jgi:hypothetical protein